MKKAIISIVLVLMTGMIMAQGLHFGPRAGFTVSKFIETNEFSGSADYTSKLGFQLGATAEFEILSFIYLGTTISLYQKGYNNDIIFGKNKNTFSFLDIPIEIGYKMPIGNVSVFGQVGPYVSVALAGRSRTIVTIEDPEPWMEDEEHSYSLYEEGYEYYKRFDTGLSVAAGVDFKQYQLRVNYAFGLSDFIANEYTKAHISSFSLTAAYLFGRNY